MITNYLNFNEMRKIILVLISSVGVIYGMNAQKPNYQLAKLFYDGKISQVISSINEISPDDQKEIVLKKLTIEKETILQEIAAVYSKSFSVSEIQEILSFYNSAVGKKWTSDIGELNSKASDIFMKWEMKKLESQ